MHVEFDFLDDSTFNVVGIVDQPTVDLRFIIEENPRFLRTDNTRDASPVRLRSRDAIDGRPRGVLSSYGISRVRFRDMAHRGELPGITKSSW